VQFPTFVNSADWHGGKRRQVAPRFHLQHFLVAERSGPGAAVRVDRPFAKSKRFHAQSPECERTSPLRCARPILGRPLFTSHGGGRCILPNVKRVSAKSKYVQRKPVPDSVHNGRRIRFFGWPAAALLGRGMISMPTGAITSAPRGKSVGDRPVFGHLQLPSNRSPSKPGEAPCVVCTPYSYWAAR